MEPDLYGIPEGFFGPLSSELPALIGRIVMLSALLETKIWYLASSVSDETQERYSRERVSENIKLTRKRLLLYQDDEKEKKFSQSAAKLLTGAEKVLDLRNAIVHGVWPESGVGTWMLWKPQLKKRGENMDWIMKKEFSRDDLRDAVTSIIQLVHFAEVVIAEAGSMPFGKRVEGQE